MTLKKLTVALALVTASAAAPAAGLTGAYAGFDLGYVMGKDSGTEYSPLGTPTNYTEETTPAGATYGLSAGNNWSIGSRLLFGVEIGYEKRSASSTELQRNLGVPDSRYPLETSLQSAFSIRAKLGYTFNSDRTMAFVAVGPAAAEIKRTFNDIPFATSQTTYAMQSGWMVGVGGEHLIADHLSIKVEYRLADFGRHLVNQEPMWTATYDDMKYTEQSVRVGVAYGF